MLIVFEGVDGSGKSTQAKMAASYLAETGRDVLEVREPGGTDLGERVRGILLDRATGDLAVEAELFLFMAARAQLVRRVIEPAIATGKFVVADRFLLSSVVYQGIVGGLGVDVVLSIGEVATAGVQPARIFVIDVDADEAKSRRDRPDDRMEERGVAYQRKIRQGYLSLAAAHDRAVVLDGSRDVDTVHADVVRHLERLGES